MSQLPGQYYEPYDSDTSNVSDGTDGTDDSEYLSDSEDPRIRREEDPRYMILQSKSMNIPGKELSKDNPTNQYAEYDKKTDIASYKDLVYLNPPKATKSSLFCIRSDSRDHRIFPSPMNFTIKLPRVYKNITKIQLVQIAFPNNKKGVTADSAFTSSFVNYIIKDGTPPCCLSTCITTTCVVLDASAMGIVEQGRLNASGTPLMTTVSVPDGAYTNNVQLGNELTYYANNTPPFNIITYDAFRDIFMNTRDISVLFNEPGDCFSSKTNNKRYGAHTKENIMNTYYTQQHIDHFPEITEVIAFNAYYYPVLKELLATQRAKPFLNTGTLSFDEIMNRFMGTFEGLQSEIYYEIGQLNQNALDIFRKNFTFQLRNINKYQWVYKDDTNQFITIHDTLHTSLHNDIQKQYQTISNQELSSHGFNTNSFKALQTSLIQYKCIYKHLETNLSTVLGNYHLVSGYQYHGSLSHSTIESTFHCLSDLHEDSDFTSMFNYQSTIGRIYGNYAGIPMKFTSFQDYHSTLSSYYTTIQSTSQTISSIHGAITSQHHTYISTKYNKILPQSMIENQSYMTNQGLPVRFITDRRLYIPGQNIVARNVRSIENNENINVSTNILANLSSNPSTSVSIKKSAKKYNGASTGASTGASINTFTNVSPMSFETLQSDSTMTDINVIVMPSVTTTSTIVMATLTPPSAPTINTINPAPTQLSVVFTPPTSNGGSPITNYEYSIVTDGAFAFAGTITSPITITGLIEGTPYQVTIRAINSVGVGANSNTFSVSTTTRPPSAPTINNIVVRNTELSVQFTPPTDNGGSPITDYQYSTGTGFSSANTTTSPLLITGLTNGTLYPVTIRAVNSAGTGKDSNTVSAKPVADNCYGKCNCFLGITGESCCQYCDLEADCECEKHCCAEIEKIVSSWYSCIPVNTVINTLAYRLGILNIGNNKIGYNITSTINTILPPFNNNLFMSINDEMGFNNLDVAMPENYTVSNETTGQVKLMFAKIMFSGIGGSGESQTLFQNPLEFETPLGKLDRFTFKIYYDDAAITPVWLASPFSSVAQEWNAIINIEEEVSKAARTSGWGSNPTVPVPSNPNATPYLYYTSKDNPNNRKQLV